MPDQPIIPNPPAPTIPQNQLVVQQEPQSSQLMSSHLEIQRLKGSNWSTWKWQLQNVLDARGLTEVLTSTQEQIPLGHPREIAARQILSGSLDASLISKVVHCKTAQQIWNCLVGIYENRTTFALTDLIGRMNSYTIKTLDQVESGISEIQVMACQIKAMGGSVDDATIESAILRALPKIFSPFIISWSFLDATHRTLDQLHAHLMRNTSILRANESTEQTEKALVVKAQDERRNPNTNFNPLSDSKSKGKFCRYCKKRGHEIAECRKLADKKKSEETKKTIDQPGSRSNQDPQKNQQSNRISYGSALMVAMKSSMYSLKVSSNLYSSTSWFMDTAASFHMTPNLKIIAGYSDLDCKFSVTIGDSRNVEVIGRGYLDTDLGILQPVFYLPQLGYNLLSLSSLAINNQIFSTVTDKSIICHIDGKNVLKGKITPSLIYETNLRVKLSKHTSLITASLDDWHDRLSHVSSRVLKYMSQNDIVEGLNISSGINEDKCESCAISKVTRARHPDRTTPRASKPGQMLSFDTAGPFPVKSMGGANYFVLCKDSCSSYRHVFFVESKSDIPDEIKRIINVCELETKNHVLCISTDLGTEFINNSLKSFLSSKGIEHKTSVAYTPEQNGYIEREIRTVSEAGRTMRIKANLSKEYWAESINTAVYTLNRVITTRNRSQTPYEVWFGFKPNLSNIHKFGELAIVRLPERCRDKLDPRGTKVVFTGYTSLFNTFRFIVPDTHEVILTCDAIFLGYLLPSSDEVCNRIDGSSSGDILKVPIYDPLVDEVSAPDSGDILNDSESPDSFYEDENLHNESQLNQSQLSLSPDIVDQNESSTSNVSNKTYDVDVSRIEFPRRTPAKMPPESQDPDRISTLRVRGNKPNYCGWKLNFTSSLDDDEPNTFDQAVSGSDAKLWIDAMNEELDSLEKCQVWTLVDRPIGHNIVSSRWVFRRKRNSDGQVTRYRARLVARGFSQIHGIDYNETFAPTASMSIVRLLFAYASLKSLKIAQFDIKTAFLYGDLDELVYMSLPDGLDNKSGKVCKLEKSLYGLKQSPRQWSIKFSEFLKSIGLNTSVEDRCVFFRHDPLIIIVIYVDDGIIFAQSESDINLVLTQLKNRFDMHNMPIETFLGFSITRHSDEHVFLHQAPYLRKVLRRFDLDNLKPDTTPMCPTKGAQITTPLFEEVPYRELVGSLLYAAIMTRPDIAFAVNVASRSVSNPILKDWNQVKRICRYLTGQVDFGLSYRADRHEGFVTYCDSDYAGDDTTCRSTTGFVIMYAGGPIHWQSSRQKYVTTSSSEAEVVSMISAVKDSIWLHNFAVELGIEKNEPITVYCDNESAIRLASNEKSSQRTRHIRTRFAYLQEQVKNRVIEVKHVRSKQQRADMLTKPLPAKDFVAARNTLMTKSILALSMLSLLMVITPNESIDIVKPIIYQETDKVLDSGYIEYEIDFTYINVCDTLRTYLPSGLADNKTKKDSSNDEAYRMNVLYVQSFIDDCQSLWTHTFKLKVEDLLRNSPHLTRSIHHIEERGVVDVIASVVTTNFINTLYEEIAPWSDHNKIKNIQSNQIVIDQRIAKFESSFNVTLSIQEKILEMAKQNALSNRETQRQLTIFKTLSERITWVSSLLQSKILFACTDLRRISEMMEYRSVATSELSELLNMTSLRGVDPLDTEFISVTQPYKNTLRFIFNVRKISKSTKVYRVYAFRYWENLTHTPVLRQYSGGNFVLYNEDINCVKGYHDFPERRIEEEECDKPNSNEDVNEWFSTQVDSIYVQDLTSIKRTPYYNYVYCFPYSITINNVTRRCATGVMKIPVKYEFTTGNRTYKPNLKRVHLASIEKGYVDMISQLHFDNTSVMLGDPIFFDRIRELSSELNLLKQEQTLSISMTKHGTAWWSTVIFFIIFTFVVTILVAFNIKLSRRLHSHSKLVVKDLAEIKNYESVSCQGCRKSLPASIPAPETLPMDELTVKLPAKRIM